MQVRSFCLLTFALPSLAALALPPAVRALRIALPDAHITAASAVPSSDSLRALGQNPYCRVEATGGAPREVSDGGDTLFHR
jgi:hypothetical protein